MSEVHCPEKYNKSGKIVAMSKQVSIGRNQVPRGASTIFRRKCSIY